MLLLKAFLARVVRQGGLIVADHDGGEHRFGEPEDSTAPLRIRLTHPEAARHIARYPQLGAGEAYMRGWLVVEPAATTSATSCCSSRATPGAKAIARLPRRDRHVRPDQFGRAARTCRQAALPRFLWPRRPAAHTRWSDDVPLLRLRRPPGATDVWTRKYIFPGGYIPALSELVVESERAGWQMMDVEAMRFHYALTLEEWYRRTLRHRAQIVAMYDERFYRMWQFYLAGAERSFRHGAMVNWQLVYVKDRAAIPMTRDWIEKESARLRAAEKPPAWRFDLAEAAK